MREDDWAELGCDWRASDAAESPELAARVRRALRRRRLGLYLELAGTALALLVVAFAFARGQGGSGEAAWLAGFAVIVVTWQLLNVATRHAFGLFVAPDAGLAGWIEAERRRARYVVAYHWLGLGGGVLVLAWAQRTLGILDDPSAARLCAVAMLGLLAWTIARTLRLRRRLARLLQERRALED
ncbi:hypothetical protein [Luteimonas huabeiensis]|uniref:hypothetical protein n=1 Tax=Luteimonas huabeiensis TaxID=1244513 RepID=UPI00046341E9|nr:hypothetical protein [Luteimonas huabeiensis]